jgi:hypothetical protein
LMIDKVRSMVIRIFRPGKRRVIPRAGTTGNRG